MDGWEKGCICNKKFTFTELEKRRIKNKKKDGGVSVVVDPSTLLEPHHNAAAPPRPNRQEREHAQGQQGTPKGLHLRYLFKQ